MEAALTNMAALQCTARRPSSAPSRFTQPARGRAASRSAKPPLFARPPLPASIFGSAASNHGSTASILEALPSFLDAKLTRSRGVRWCTPQSSYPWRLGSISSGLSRAMRAAARYWADITCAAARWRTLHRLRQLVKMDKEKYETAWQVACSAKSNAFLAQSVLQRLVIVVDFAECGATWCAVLSSGMVRPGCYVMCGAELGESRRVCCAIEPIFGCN